MKRFRPVRKAAHVSHGRYGVMRFVTSIMRETASDSFMEEANGVFAESYAYDALGRRVATTNREGLGRDLS